MWQEHKKRLQEMQRKQAVKEVRFSATTADNDMQVIVLLCNIVAQLTSCDSAAETGTKAERVARWWEKKRAWHEENPGRPFPKGIKYPKPRPWLANKKKKRKGPITWPSKKTRKKWKERERLLAEAAACGSAQQGRTPVGTTAHVATSPAARQGGKHSRSPVHAGQQ